MYRNSIYIILNSISSAGLGFIFWIFAARLFSTSDVGVAAALISTMTLLVQLSRFGLDQSMIRYIKEYSVGSIFFTSLFISTTFAMLFGIILISGVHLWASELIIVREYAAIFLGVLILYSIFTITAVMYLALRDGKHYLFQSLFVGARFLFLMPLVEFGPMGIILSYGISLLLGITYSGFNLMISEVKFEKIDLLYIRTSLTFSGANYLGQLFLNLPSLLLPAIILNLLGAEASAFFYIPYTVASILLTIPAAVSNSLFVEGSHGESVNENTKKAIYLIASLLIPGVLILSLSGNAILCFFGENYVAAIPLYQLLLLSSVFVSITQVYIALQKVKRNNLSMVYFTAAEFTLLMVLTFVFIQMHGLIGVGYAWVTGYAICSLPLINGIRHEIA